MPESLERDLVKVSVTHKLARTRSRREEKEEQLAKLNASDHDERRRSPVTVTKIRTSATEGNVFSKYANRASSKGVVGVVEEKDSRSNTDTENTEGDDSSDDDPFSKYAERASNKKVTRLGAYEFPYHSF